MNFDFSVIQNPTTENPVCNSISGTLPNGQTIVVSRHQTHWDVNLKIVINDFIWHDSVALPPERLAFNELRNRALDIRYQQFQTNRDNACSAGNILLVKA